MRPPPHAAGSSGRSASRCIRTPSSRCAQHPNLGRMRSALPPPCAAADVRGFGRPAGSASSPGTA